MMPPKPDRNLQWCPECEANGIWEALHWITNSVIGCHKCGYRQDVPDEPLSADELQQMAEEDEP